MLLNVFKYISRPFSTLIKKPSKNIVTLSDDAYLKLKEIINNANDRIVYLSLTHKGCNGYVYNMKLKGIADIHEMDEKVYDKNGNLLLVIENKSTFYLLGSHIDHKITELEEGFTFNNPNIKSVCGCGLSFQFNEKI